MSTTPKKHEELRYHIFKAAQRVMIEQGDDLTVVVRFSKLDHHAQNYWSQALTITHEDTRCEISRAFRRDAVKIHIGKRNNPRKTIITLEPGQLIKSFERGWQKHYDQAITDFLRLVLAQTEKDLAQAVENT